MRRARGRFKIWVAGAAAGAVAWATPGLLLAAAGAEKHEPGIINLDKSMILQVINLLILLFVLQKFLFKPLTQFLAKRAEGIKQSLDEARLAREAAGRAPGGDRAPGAAPRGGAGGAGGAAGGPGEESGARGAATQRGAAAMRKRGQRGAEDERQRLLKA